MSFFELFRPKTEKQSQEGQETVASEKSAGAMDTEVQRAAEEELLMHEASMREKMEQENEIDHPVD